MHIKACLVLLIAMGSLPAFGKGDDDTQRAMLQECQVVAKELNQTQKVGIRMAGMQALVTWRAACAERPPTGAGMVTALCEGNRVTAKGEDRVFFWEKSNRGKLKRGFFVCTG